MNAGAPAHGPHNDPERTARQRVPPVLRAAGRARGDGYEELDAMLTPGGSPGINWKSSMAQDITKGRRSETAFMNGFVAETGAKSGVATPVNDAIIEVMRAIDDKRLDPSPDNIELTLRKAGI